MKFSHQSFVWLCAMFLLACQSSQTSNQKEDKPLLVEEKKVETDHEEVEVAVELSLPSVVQVGQLFKKAGLRYIDDLTNTAENVSKYSSRTSKLLNYGIYSTDLTYCVLNNQSNEALKYIKTLKELGVDIGFAEIYSNRDLFARFEQNLGTPDSILNIMDEIQEQTDFLIDEAGLKKESIQVFTGAWIEGMYLGSEASVGEDRELVTYRIAEQIHLLTDILEVYKVNEYNEGELSSLYHKLSELLNYYSELDSVKEAPEGKGVIHLSLTEMHGLASQIQELRTFIVQ